ncbi:hypothetical protein MGN70_006239 [Eutypa lata]|nr:hypothetical protein MGN70_006239 [Eutypa lata]
MCTQTYLQFSGCGCQLRYRLEECKHGRTSPQCVHVKQAVKPTHRSYCHHHKKVQAQRQQTWERYWAGQGRQLWPAPRAPPLGTPMVF